MALHCRQIPLLPGLEAIRLRGGQDGADNIVRWPYVAENRSFKAWTHGGELVFVTGIGRHRDAQNLAECLYEGVESGISGLVVLTGDAYIGQIPSALVRLADELSLPLFEQPYSLPMVTVTEVISRAIVAAEAHDASLPAQNAPGLAAAIKRQIGQQTLEALLQEHLGNGLTSVRQANATLKAWCTCHGNLSEAAKALGCHRNTVRNRMQRIFQATGLDPNAAEDIETLLLAHLLLNADQHSHS
ncbi:PucR family transcriptional regulator [Alkalilimnicola ehrlichii]|uniref:PucR family transcriptional regulator n=1 Tax=Alkalilimnicola ehrlichii TaxID=351052 RepID=A0A3E0X1L5_9GAMM|nr:PucR family transcriptional regulator [Alkalilimnicola ehrlichii]RFA30789.1 PucR family transcriptional regulator [Alkalilimnicola ehrlichii]RFA38367.1 PucR family transcriptional regulator [Alkalilimnicola ehrlichii]